LMIPQRFFTHGQRNNGDRHVYAQRTRFIPNSVLSHFESRSWPPPKSVSEADAWTREPVSLRQRSDLGGRSQFLSIRHAA
jgi:DNA helicase-2/ATP-dependent DNA helicase PcrA